jgi:hypothetical protein
MSQKAETRAWALPIVARFDPTRIAVAWEVLTSTRAYILSKDGRRLPVKKVRNVVGWRIDFDAL